MPANYLTRAADREIRAAPSLDELLRLLRRHLGRSERGEDWEVTQREDALLADLPTFGGPRLQPGNSVIWSWDATRQLEGLCVDEMRIVPRPSCSFEGCARVTDVAGATGGLCPGHYQQQRRGRPLSALRPPVGERGDRARLTVRVSAETLARLRAAGQPATVASDVLARWARG